MKYEILGKPAIIFNGNINLIEPKFNYSLIVILAMIYLILICIEEFKMRIILKIIKKLLVIFGAIFIFVFSCGDMITTTNFYNKFMIED